MNSIGVVTLHKPRYFNVSVLVAIKFIHTYALILEDPVERLDMCILVWCPTWDSFMINVYFCTVVFKNMANKLWAIISPNDRLAVAIK